MLSRRNWVDVSCDEVWSFLGISMLMGIYELPKISNCAEYNVKGQILVLWSNLHTVDNETTPAKGGPSRKIKPVLDSLSETFLKCYSLELAILEVMVKYKGYAKENERCTCPENP